MKIAMIIAGVVALLLIAIGCFPYIKAVKNEDAAQKQKAMRWFSIASIFLTAFFILLIILVVRALFSFL